MTTTSGLVLSWLALAALSGQTTSTPSFSEHFVEANGIRLHYLDWGGEGDPLVFLTGFGTAAATFDDLAVALRRRFRVYALTRRGLPPSQTPAAGYELSTLVADIMAFLDAKELARVHFVGHSLAGIEMTAIASRWPGRVRSLVYLDAIADPVTARAVLLKDPLGTSPSTGVIWEQISRWWNVYSINFSGVKAPTLSISAMLRQHPGLPPDANIEIRERANAYWRSAAVPVEEGWLDKIRREIPHATVISYEDAGHYVYLDRAADVLAEMKRFYSTFQ
jgi:pimeloyl-ACP methyl ester carboxylesterase